MQDLTQPDYSESLKVNPFRDDVYSPQSPIPGTPQIHQEEITYCVQAIEKMVALSGHVLGSQAHGEMISISSPLAGYGKSHLISRISKAMPKSVSMVELSFGTRFSWGNLLALSLHNLDANSSPADPDMSLLDDAAAFFLSSLVRTAYSQGIIEEKECPVPMSTLRTDYGTAFSDGGRNKLLTWLKKKSPAMRSRVNLYPKFARFSKDDTSFWTECCLGHFRKEDAGFGALTNLPESESRDRFLQLLRIASTSHPLLIVADHLDYCHGSPTAGMDIATALTSIMENVANCVLLISINKDLWESVFQNKLPSALLDRLSGESLELCPVELDEAKEMLVNRLCSSGVTHQQSHLFANAVSEDCNWTEAKELFPRRILREAKEVWKRRGHEFYELEIQNPEPSRDLAGGLDRNNSINQDPDFDQLLAGEHPLFPDPMEDPQTPDPFKGHSMVYSDRPATKAPVPQPLETGSSRASFYESTSSPNPLQPTPDNLPAGQMGAGPLPQNGGSPQTNPAVQYKDEPAVCPPAGSASVPHVNGKTNGHAVSHGKNLNLVPPYPNPLEVYFDQLEKEYSEMADQLEIDFPALEAFVKTIGNKHTPLTQNELSITGGQSSCLRWILSNYTVWIGFEPARNIYYYSNVLQKLMSDPSGKPGKIVCFSHSSHPFSKDVLTTSGLTSDVLKRYFDFIQLSNGELALLTAAARFLRVATEQGHEVEALKFIIKKLNPLWQRLCQPLSGSIK